jgi:transposase-like protein
MAKKQQFAAEFRKEAVRQVTERGLKVTDVAARLGVSAPSLYKWVNEDRPDPEAKDKVELVQLRREVLRLRSELASVQEDREMFVSVERADQASRFVNGDWSEIDLILPFVDRFVRAGGWSIAVMNSFLTLCERAKSTYPAESFSDQILAIIDDDLVVLGSWQGTLFQVRIAALVQHITERDSPMQSPLAQKFLRILDRLVDIGDRRSAALQLSETFREVRVSG